MPELNESTFLYVTGALLALALFFFLVSLRLFRRSRRDVFWRRRREAGRRGWRLFLFSLLLLIFSGMSCGVTAMWGYFAPDNEPPAGATERASELTSITPAEITPPPVEQPSAAVAELASPTPNVPPVETPSPVTTVIVVVTATPATGTPSETPFVTFTPNVAPVVSSVTPLPNAQIVITALDDQISDALKPVDPRTAFPAGIKRLYLFVEFRGMTRGILWRRALYRDGELIEENSYLWGSETEGSGYFFFGNDNGFAPGNYELRLYIGDSATPISSMPFTIASTSP